MLSRRSWIRRVVGALLTSQLPVPVSKAGCVFVPALSPELAELNAVTLALMRPVTDNYFQTTPLLSHLRSHSPLRWEGKPIEADPYAPGGAP